MTSNDSHQDAPDNRTADPISKLLEAAPLRPLLLVIVGIVIGVMIAGSMTAQGYAFGVGSVLAGSALYYITAEDND